MVAVVVVMSSTTSVSPGTVQASIHQGELEYDGYKEPLPYNRQNDQKPEYTLALSPYGPCPRREDDFERALSLAGITAAPGCLLSRSEDMIATVRRHVATFVRVIASYPQPMISY
jgi:hypothetical protein